MTKFTAHIVLLLAALSCLACAHSAYASPGTMFQPYSPFSVLLHPSECVSQGLPNALHIRSVLNVLTTYSALVSNDALPPIRHAFVKKTTVPSGPEDPAIRACIIDMQNGGWCDLGVNVGLNARFIYNSSNPSLWQNQLILEDQNHADGYPLLLYICVPSTIGMNISLQIASSYGGEAHPHGTLAFSVQETSFLVGFLFVCLLASSAGCCGCWTWCYYTRRQWTRRRVAIRRGKDPRLRSKTETCSFMYEKSSLIPLSCDACVVLYQLAFFALLLLAMFGNPDFVPGDLMPVGLDNPIPGDTTAKPTWITDNFRGMGIANGDPFVFLGRSMEDLLQTSYDHPFVGPRTFAVPVLGGDSSDPLELRTLTVMGIGDAYFAPYERSCLDDLRSNIELQPIAKRIQSCDSFLGPVLNPHRTLAEYDVNHLTDTVPLFIGLSLLFAAFAVIIEYVDRKTLMQNVILSSAWLFAKRVIRVLCSIISFIFDIVSIFILWRTMDTMFCLPQPVYDAAGVPHLCPTGGDEHSWKAAAPVLKATVGDGFELVFVLMLLKPIFSVLVLLPLSAYLSLFPVIGRFYAQQKASFLERLFLRRLAVFVFEKRVETEWKKLGLGFEDSERHVNVAMKELKQPLLTDGSEITPSAATPKTPVFLVEERPRDHRDADEEGEYVPADSR